MRTALLAACLAALAAPGIAAARPAPITWCGADEVAANRVPDLELTSADQGSYYGAESTPVDQLDTDLEAAFPTSQKTIVY